MPAGPFDRPIPGASLTAKKGKWPWENPPEIVDVRDVLNYYLDKLGDEEVIDDIGMLCEMGIPLKPIVRTFVTSQQMEGKHSVDTGLIVAPIIHEFLKQSIEATGITVKDDDRDYKKEAEQREMRRFKARTMKYINDIDKQGDPGVELLKDIVEADETVEPTPEEEKPQGLMARG